MFAEICLCFRGPGQIFLLPVVLKVFCLIEMFLLKKIWIFFLLCLFLSPAIADAAPITSPFGWRTHPITGEWKFHSGVDIGYDYGTDITAMLPGTVVYAAPWDGYGNCVILEHENGDHTLYGHCSEIYVSYGQYVNKGDVIAVVGSTGNSTGPHLHLEWWHNGEYADPLGLWQL